MSEYHIVRADGSGSIASFDRWGASVVKAWHAAARKQSVNLICMWPCGCLRRALVENRTIPPTAKFVKDEIRRGRKKTVRVHVGWRRFESCEQHKRLEHAKTETETEERECALSSHGG